MKQPYTFHPLLFLAPSSVTAGALSLNALAQLGRLGESGQCCTYTRCESWALVRPVVLAYRYI